MNWQLLTAYLLLPLIPLIIFGNLLVLISIWRESQLRIPAYCLISCLALADLLAGLVSTPLMAYIYIVDVSPVEDGDWKYAGFWYLPNVISAASLLHTLLLTSERLVAVLRPLHARVWCVPSRMRWVSFAVWIVLLLWWALPFLALPFGVALMLSPAFIMSSIILFYILPLVLVLVQWIIIICIIKKHRRRHFDPNQGEMAVPVRQQPTQVFHVDCSTPSNQSSGIHSNQRLNITKKQSAASKEDHRLLITVSYVIFMLVVGYIPNSVWWTMSLFMENTEAMGIFSSLSNILQMIPCSFADLGKAAKDLFDKDFSLGVIKVTHRAKTIDNLEVAVSGTKVVNAAESVSSISGHLESKYKEPKYGLTVTEKWTTNNVITSDICLEDCLLKGLKKNLEIVFEPLTGKRSAKLKSDYKQKYVHLNVDVDLPSKSPILNASLVLGCEPQYGFLAGIQGTFDTSNGTLSKYQYALGMDRGDLVLNGLLVNHNDVQASVFQRLSNRVETAATVSYAHNTKVSRFGVAAKYNWDRNTFVKGKVDTAGIVQVAYGFLLRDGFKMTLSGQFDGKNLDAGNHRLGLALDFES